jgi:hypothetical protein
VTVDVDVRRYPVCSKLREFGALTPFLAAPEALFRGQNQPDARPDEVGQHFSPPSAGAASRSGVSLLEERRATGSFCPRPWGISIGPAA